MPSSGRTNRHPILWLLVLSLLLGGFVTRSQAQAPTAPTFNSVSFSILSSDYYGFLLQWTDNSNNETSFEVYFSYSPNPVTAFAVQTGLPANSTQAHIYLVNGALPANTTVYFWVLAKNGDLNGTSNSLPLTWNGSNTFNPPTDVTSSFPSTNVFRLNWTDNSNSEEYTEIWARDTSNVANAFQLIAGAPWNIVQQDLYYYLQPGVSYEIKLRQRKHSGAYGSGLLYTAYTTPFTVTAPGTYSATPPAAPTNLSVAAFIDTANGNANGFGVYFDDASTDETGFEFQDKAAGAADTTFASLGVMNGATGTNLSYGTDISGYTAGAGRDFRVRALRGNGPFAIPSAFTATSGATLASFNAPADLRVTAPADNGRVQFFWSDNATAETGYQIEYRYGTSGTFTSLGTLSTTDYSRYQNSGGIGVFTPSSTVQFQIAATNGSTLTGYSNIATVVMPPLTAPTNLAHTTPANERVVLTWTDNSGNEDAYQVLGLFPGDSTFSSFGFVAANTTTATIDGIPPGTQFRVRASYGSGPDGYSDVSNTITANPVFSPPTALTATAASDRQINLTWTDNSAAEAGYAIYCKPSTDSQFQFCGVVGENVSTFSARFVDSGFNTPFTPNTTYQFEVYAFFGSSLSTAATGSATTKDGATSDLSPPMFVNEAFSYTFTATTGQGTISSTSLTGTLPPGVTYDTGTRVLSGTPTARGAFTPTLNVTWSNGWSTTYTLHLRPIYRPARPQVVTPIADHTLTLGGASASLTIPLAATFADPDSESAVAIRIPGADGTPSGRTINIILNDSATPLTVANFRAYLNDATDGYTGTVFHRLISGFVLQGGAYKKGASSNAFVSVPKLAAVQNEPGIANVLGTLAMAKQGGNPNSATTDFFFNLADNTANLDFQNEGFTVFGRVSQPSLSILSVLNLLPQPPASGDVNNPNYAVTIDGQSTFLTQLPHNAATAPASINPGQLLTIDSVVSSVPVLNSPTVSGNTNSSAVSATISGTDLVLNGLTGGASTISLQVSDLDGNQLLTPLSFNVTVMNTLGAWATAEGLPSGQDGPDADPDNDGRKNLLEYALMSSPGTSNGSADPAVSSTTDGADKKATITFKVRKFATLTYTVEGSSNLTSWTTVWSSTDGFAAANVASAVNNSDHTLVTIKDSVPYTDTTPRFLRLTVTSP